MKPQAMDTIYSTGSESEETIRMQLSAEDFAHIAGVLTNLYSDKPMAVIREYTTNAYDSHIEAGNPAPIQITLPTPANPVWKVRDYGIGLSVDDIRDIYSLYGRSTKRESNEVSGVLGLGCKSALCYAVSFTVVGVKDGVKTVAVVSKDADGVGSIQIMDTVSTTESNGVTISVPVRPGDVTVFSNKTLEFVKYWQPSTVLVNGEDKSGIDRSEYLWLDDEIGVKPRNYNTNGKIVMGNIAYPFTPNGRFDVIAYLPLGSVHFTPSREALQYTRLTTETIALLEEYINEAFTRALCAELEAAKDNFSRIKIYRRWLTAMPPQARALMHMFGGTSGMGTYEVKIEGQGWVYDPNHYSSRKAYSFTGLQWDLILSTDIAIVTGYPNQVLPAGHRERLHAYGINKRCVVVPAGSNLQLLDGRPNVHRWDDIAQATGGVGKGKGPRRPPTKYHVTYKGATKALAADEIDEKVKIVYYGPFEHSPRISLYPDVQIVKLTGRQIAGFEKLFPNAEKFVNFDREWTSEYLKLVPTEVHEALHLLGNRTWLASIADRFDDPLLQRAGDIIQRAKDPQSALAKALAEFQKFVPHRNPDKNDLASTVNERYPLFERYYYSMSALLIDDLVIYANAKYAAILAQETKETA